MSKDLVTKDSKRLYNSNIYRRSWRGAPYLPAGLLKLNLMYWKKLQTWMLIYTKDSVINLK